MSDHENCPACNTKLNVTHFGRNIWKDCLKCNKKLEDILAEQSSQPPKIYTSDSESTDDWDLLLKCL